MCNYSSCNYHYHGITVHTAQLLKYILIICSTCLLVIISQRLELSGYCRPQGNNNLYPPPLVLAAKYGVAGPVLCCWSMAHTVNITDSKGDVLLGLLRAKRSGFVRRLNTSLKAFEWVESWSRNLCLLLLFWNWLEEHI